MTREQVKEGRISEGTQSRAPPGFLSYALRNPLTFCSGPVHRYYKWMLNRHGVL